MVRTVPRDPRTRVGRRLYYWASLLIFLVFGLIGVAALHLRVVPYGLLLIAAYYAAQAIAFEVIAHRRR